MEIDELKNASAKLAQEIARKKEEKSQQERREFVSSIAKEFAQELKPVIDQISSEARTARTETVEAISRIKIDSPVVNIPEIKVPEANVKLEMPEIKVPEANVNVTIPEIKVPEARVTVDMPSFPEIPPFPVPVINIPEIKIPDVNVNLPDKMTVQGDVGLRGVDRNNPVPTLLVDLKGNPVSMSSVTGGGGRTNPNLTVNNTMVTFGQKTMANSIPVVLPSDQSITLTTGDIEIGAVEIKDGDSDTRLDVEADSGGKNAMFVQANNLDIRDLTTGDSITSYQSSGSIYSTNVTNTVPVSQSGTWTVNPSYSTQSDTYTATGNGTTVDISTTPVQSFSLSVTGTGTSATAWTVILEGSLNGTNFSTIATHETTTGDGNLISTGANLYPVLYYRTRTTTLTLGTATNIIAKVIGLR